MPEGRDAILQSEYNLMNNKLQEDIELTSVRLQASNIELTKQVQHLLTRVVELNEQLEKQKKSTLQPASRSKKKDETPPAAE